MVITIVVPNPAVGTGVSLTWIKEIGGAEWIIQTLLRTVHFCIYQPLPKLIITICVTAKSNLVKEVSRIWWSNLLDHIFAPPPVEFRVGNVAT